MTENKAPRVAASAGLRPHVLPPLLSLEQEIVCNAIERNFAEVVASWAALPQCKMIERDGTTLYVTGLPYPLFNGACLTNISERDTPERIRNVLAFFAQRRLPMIWVVGPGTRPANLGRHLIEAGLEHAYDCLGMAIDLGRLPGSVPITESVAFRLIDNRDDLKRWVKAYIRLFGFPKSIEEGCRALFEGLGLEGGWRRWAAFVGSEVVAVLSAFLGSEVVGIYDVSTAEGFRRRGIGRAMTLFALMDTPRMGYHIAILGSTEMGQGLYRQMGFREYCALSFYTWNGLFANSLP